MVDARHKIEHGWNLVEIVLAMGRDPTNTNHYRIEIQNRNLTLIFPGGLNKVPDVNQADLNRYMRLYVPVNSARELKHETLWKSYLNRVAYYRQAVSGSPPTNERHSQTEAMTRLLETMIATLDLQPKNLPKEWLDWKSRWDTDRADLQTREAELAAARTLREIGDVKLFSSDEESTSPSSTGPLHT